MLYSGDVLYLEQKQYCGNSLLHNGMIEVILCFFSIIMEILQRVHKQQRVRRHQHEHKWKIIHQHLVVKKPAVECQR